MIFRPILAFICFIIASSAYTFGQNNPKVLDPQTIEAVMLADREFTQQLYYLDINGKYQPFHIIKGGRGGKNMQPLSDRFVLCKKSTDDQGNIIMTPVMRIKIPQTENVLLLFYGKKDGSMDHEVLVDGIDAHPGGTGRIINLTNERAICVIGETKQLLSPGESIVTDSLRVNGDRFDFGFAIDSEERARNLISVQRLRLRSDNTRFLAALVYTNYNFAKEDNAEEKIGRISNCWTLYDYAPN